MPVAALDPHLTRSACWPSSKLAAKRDPAARLGGPVTWPFRRSAGGGHRSSRARRSPGHRHRPVGDGIGRRQRFVDRLDLLRRPRKRARDAVCQQWRFRQHPQQLCGAALMALRGRGVGSRLTVLDEGEARRRQRLSPTRGQSETAIDDLAATNDLAGGQRRPDPRGHHRDRRAPRYLGPRRGIADHPRSAGGFARLTTRVRPVNGWPCRRSWRWGCSSSPYAAAPTARPRIAA